MTGRPTSSTSVSAEIGHRGAPWQARGPTAGCHDAADETCERSAPSGITRLGLRPAIADWEADIAGDAVVAAVCRDAATRDVRLSPWILCSGGHPTGDGDNCPRGCIRFRLRSADGCRGGGEVRRPELRLH